MISGLDPQNILPNLLKGYLKWVQMFLTGIRCVYIHISLINVNRDMHQKNLT